MAVLTGFALKMLAEIALSKLFTRTSKGDTSTQLDTYKQLDAKFKSKEIPAALTKDAAPAENYTNQIGNDATIDSQYKSLYDSLSEASKKQIESNYEVYNNINSKLENVNTRIDVLSQNVDLTKDAVSTFGKMSSEAVTKSTGLLGTLVSTVKNVVSKITEGVTSVLLAPILGIQTLVSKVNSRFETQDNPDSNSYSTDFDAAPKAKEAYDQSVETQQGLQNQLDEAQSAYNKLKEEQSTLLDHLSSGQVIESEKQAVLNQLDTLNTNIAKQEQEIKTFKTAIEDEQRVQSVATSGATVMTINKLSDENQSYIFNSSSDFLTNNPKNTQYMNNQAIQKLTESDLQVLNELRDWLFDEKNGLSNADIRNVYLRGDELVTDADIQSLREKDKLTKDNLTGTEVRALIKVHNQLQAVKQENLGNLLNSDVFTDLNEHYLESGKEDDLGTWFRDKLGLEVADNEGLNSTLTPVERLIKANEEGAFTIKKGSKDVNFYQFMADVGEDRQRLQYYHFFDSKGTEITEDFINEMFPNNTYATLSSGSNDQVVSTDFRGRTTTQDMYTFDSGKPTTELMTADSDLTMYEEGAASEKLHKLKSNAVYKSDIQELETMAGGDYSEVVDMLLDQKGGTSQELEDMIDTASDYSRRGATWFSDLLEETRDSAKLAAAAATANVQKSGDTYVVNTVYQSKDTDT